MSTQKSGSKTMLLSVIMSSPGPLVVGLGLLAGRSSTQIADFVRRSAELLAIVLSFLVYKYTAAEDPRRKVRKDRLEQGCNLFAGAMMCIGGCLMIALALMPQETDKGNVIPGLCIAVMGVIANTLFWRKYTRLNKAAPNAILAVQARLYRAKSLVDACVSTALLSVAIAPESALSAWLDRVGSAVVAVYLVWCGVRTIWESANALRKKTF